MRRESKGRNARTEVRLKDKGSESTKNKKQHPQVRMLLIYADFGSVLFVILGIIVIRITLGGDIDHGLVCLRPDRVGDGEKLLVL